MEKRINRNYTQTISVGSMLDMFLEKSYESFLQLFGKSIQPKSEVDYTFEKTVPD